MVLLWNNNALGQIRDDMLDLDIEPIGVLPRNPDFQLLGQAFGCVMHKPDSLAALAESLTTAFALPGVSLVELNYVDVLDAEHA